MLRIVPGVVIERLPRQLLWMLLEIDMAADECGEQVWISGCQEPKVYPEGKVHRMGYAVDLRVWNLIDPDTFVAHLRHELPESEHFKVLYGDEGHLDHIHVGYSWSFAGSERGPIHT